MKGRSIVNFHLKNSIASLLLIFLFACKGKNRHKIVDGDDLVPQEPTFISYFSVQGEDKDNDGIRDDVENWINDNFDTYNLRMAVKQNARAYFNLINSKDSYQAYESNLKVFEAHDCLMFVAIEFANEKKIYESAGLLYSKVGNSFWRKRFISQKLNLIPKDRSYSSSPDRYKWYRGCQFKIQNERLIIKKHLDSNDIMTETRDSFNKLLKEIK